ncbi:hypothetical protein [Methylobacterium trifolii]|uniref:Uncharacterized protein n=1 Tax=Methylobacterium trifolii TaxID=1003092 RepID=A0ABQ4U0B9_9HYPH|nr:hypothetical protein [Methylobacterium trifolii]GJE60928.1 hypothetical protein MPOCJGCO_3047 [Methylobacterium trifolii]
MTVKSWSHPSPLAVFAKGGFSGGSWATVMGDAMKIFNTLMATNGVNVSLSDAKDEASAQIVVDAVAKQASFSYRGATYSKAFSGDGMHGLTVAVSDQGTGLIDRQFVFVPATPRADASNQKSRQVGPEVRRFILVHEFIHAAGLSNDEHTLEDVFCYPGEFVEGRSAGADRLQPWGGLGKPMPPYTINAKTVANLQKAWP